MNKYILSLLFVCSVLTFGYSQEKQVDPSLNLFEFEELIPFGKNGFAMVLLNSTERPARMAVQFFDNDEKMVAEKTIDLRKQGLRAQFEGAFAWQGRLCILTSLYYPGPKRNHLIMRQFSVPGLQELYTEVVDEAYTPELYRVPFGHAISPDSSKLALYSWTYTLPEDPAKVSVQVFNTRMEEEWSERYILPFKNEGLFIYGSAITDDKRVYLFCENYTGRPGRDIDETKVQHIVLGAEGKPEELLKYDINIADKDITLRGVQLKMLKDNTIAGAAFYNEKRKARHLGLYTFRISADGKELNRKQHSIPDENYEAAYPYGEKESIFNAQRHRFQDYFVDNLFLHEDGSLSIVAEQKVERPNYIELEFNDMLIAKVNSNMDRLQWITRVPKRQLAFQSKWDIFSYQSFLKDDKVYLLFNDAGQNHDQDGPPRSLDIYDGNKAAIILTQIDQQGKQFKYDLTPLSRSRQVAVVYPRRAWFQNDGLLMYGERGRGISVTGLLYGFTWEELFKQ